MWFFCMEFFGVHVHVDARQDILNKATLERNCWISSSRRRQVSCKSLTSLSFFSRAASNCAIFSAGRDMLSMWTLLREAELHRGPNSTNCSYRQFRHFGRFRHFMGHNDQTDRQFFGLSSEVRQMFFLKKHRGHSVMFCFSYRRDCMIWISTVCACWFEELAKMEPTERGNVSEDPALWGTQMEDLPVSVAWSLHPADPSTFPKSVSWVMTDSNGNLHRYAKMLGLAVKKSHIHVSRCVHFLSFVVAD